jgi:hypothetical protein
MKWNHAQALSAGPSRPLNPLDRRPPIPLPRAADPARPLVTVGLRRPGTRPPPDGS